MNTVNVSAEVLRELGYIADNSSYMEKVLDYIRSLTKKNVVQRGAIYTSLLEQLSDFQEYEAGWDGAGALPLSKKVVKNFKAVLAKASEKSLQGWHLEPQSNGTLLMQDYNCNAGINLGTKDFSYFIIIDGNVEGQNNVKFSPNAVLNVIRKING